MKCPDMRAREIEARRSRRYDDADFFRQVADVLERDHNDPVCCVPAHSAHIGAPDGQLLSRYDGSILVWIADSDGNPINQDFHRFFEET